MAFWLVSSWVLKWKFTMEDLLLREKEEEEVEASMQEKCASDLAIF